mgnify:CR=1 FL=1
MSGVTEVYVGNDLVDAGTLLQGDILIDVHLLGALTYQEILLGTPSAGGTEPQAWTIPKPPIRGDAMVLSHSCEVATENGVKVTSIILAPLRDVSGATKPDKLAELIESNLIASSGAKASYLKYFYVEPHTLLSYPKGAVVDFSKLFSVRKTSYEYLLERKRIELAEATRQEMSLKLALYFHRESAKNAA